MAKPTNAAIVDLQGRKWQPFESADPTGHVVYTETSGEIHIPYGADPVSLTIQAHELSHVRYSAKVWPNIHVALPRLMALAKTNSAIVGYAEDMRITALAGRLGVKTLPSFDSPEDAPVIKAWVNSFVEAGIPEERVQKAVRFILNAHTTVLDRIGLDLRSLQQPKNAERYIVFCAQHIHKLLEQGKDDSHAEGESEGESKSTGKPAGGKSAKADKFEKSKAKSDSEKSETSETSDTKDGESDEDTEGSESEGDEGEAEDGNGEDEAESAKGKGSKDDGKPIDLSEMALPDVKQAMVANVPPPVDTEKLIHEFQHVLDTANWIPVKAIERVPLVRRAAQARHKGRKLSETGVALGSAYDAVSPNERRPFTAKRRGGAGGLTVVIDCSGSMAIDESQLETLLLRYPQGVVVTYSSYIGSRAYGGDKAVVRVIASHGRLSATADFRDPRAGGNGCDGPVLEWLAKQPGERVWVCDGAITQHGDTTVYYAADGMAEWLKAHHITRFDSLGEYLQSLNK